MALEIDYNTNFGILCRDAICVIVDTRCNKEIDAEGNVTKRGTRIVDEKYARFTKRLLDKPQPPKMQIKEKTGQKESIDEYRESSAYKKYQKDYKKWVYEGDFNSDKIPMLNKYFGVTDMPTTKIKN